ncbi:NAD(P)H-hydrate dehydratase [Negadavirga shengliensis]|uniref:Bifunctional NAD(P)H-hydrate repair enzyme n=1 Tax=Negadavirga shengliensis TaxID=1389218 RepID=A0ABV9T3L5_9BACT
MQKILSGIDVKKLDQQYIKGEGITSFQLMERAASTFCDWFVSMFPSNTLDIAVFCGIGNNGGDGLAISRLLAERGYLVAVYVIGNSEKGSADFKNNLEFLPETVLLTDWEPGLDFHAEIIIDGIFGVGINRPLEGGYQQLVLELNEHKGTKISIDVPSGLPTDGVLSGTAFKADYTLSFQFPKLSLLIPEHAVFTGELIVKSIGIDSFYFDAFDSPYFFFNGDGITERHRKFHRFSHKGDFGRVMLVGGSYGKIGAMLMASAAALRTGSGLVFAHVPKCGVGILQTSIPELMVSPSEFEEEVGGKFSFPGLDALGVGPGMGKGQRAAALLHDILRNFEGPLVLDADALNLLSDNPDWYDLLGENTVLTPHLKEFERLVGPCADHFDRMEKARLFCRNYGCTLILKGANTLITFPDGKQVFNASGSKYMASGGSGDVLTGMVTSFLGQGYEIKNAVLCGVFHHGHAGELASSEKRRGTVATDIIEAIPKSFLHFDVG